MYKFYNSYIKLKINIVAQIMNDCIVGLIWYPPYTTLYFSPCHLNSLTLLQFPKLAPTHIHVQKVLCKLSRVLLSHTLKSLITQLLRLHRSQTFSVMFLSTILDDMKFPKCLSESTTRIYSTCR